MLAASTHSENMFFLDYGKGKEEKNKLVRVQTLDFSGF